MENNNETMQEPFMLIGQRGCQTALDAGNYDQMIYSQDGVTQRKAGDYLMSVASTTPQEAVFFSGKQGEVYVLLDGKKELLAHQTENGVFVAEQNEKEGQTQAAILWKKISNDNMERMFERVRDAGKVHYINPQEHRLAEGIFNGSYDNPSVHVKLPKGDVFEEICGVTDFAYKGGWLYSLEKGKDNASRLTTARLTVDAICEKMTSSGEVFKTVWKITVYANNEKKRWAIDEEKIATEVLAKLKCTRGVQLVEGNRVGNSILNFVRELAGMAKIERILCEAGWQSIDGNMIYAHDAHDPIDRYTICTQKNISRLANVNGADVFMKAVGLFKDESLAGPLLVYAVYGIMYHVCADAGIVCQTILFLCGPTGCQKSSIAKVLYRFFDADIKEAPQSFQSTMGSIDSLVNQGRDGNLLMDDFCPNTGNCDEKDLYGKLERIVRLFGDNSSRRALNANHETSRVANVQGGAVVTGEISGRAKSSLLRMLTVEMDYNAIDLNKLDVFQTETKLWTTFIYDFIAFIENNYETVKSVLQSMFSGFRKEGRRHFDDGRIIDHYAILMSILQIIKQFLMENGVGPKTIMELETKFEKGILDACQHSAELANDRDSWAYYLEALYNVLDATIDTIAVSKKEFENNPSLLGYKGRKGWVYIKADKLEQMVKKYLMASDKLACFLSNESAFRILGKNHLIKSYANGKVKTKDGSEKRQRHSYTISTNVGGVSNRLVTIDVDRLHEEVMKLS